MRRFTLQLAHCYVYFLLVLLAPLAPVSAVERWPSEYLSSKNLNSKHDAQHPRFKPDCNRFPHSPNCNSIALDANAASTLPQAADYYSFYPYTTAIRVLKDEEHNFFGELGFHSRDDQQRETDRTYLWFLPQRTTTVEATMPVSSQKPETSTMYITTTETTTTFVYITVHPFPLSITSFPDQLINSAARKMPRPSQLPNLNPSWRPFGTPVANPHRLPAFEGKPYIEPGIIRAFRIPRDFDKSMHSQSLMGASSGYTGTNFNPSPVRISQKSENLYKTNNKRQRRFLSTKESMVSAKDETNNDSNDSFKSINLEESLQTHFLAQVVLNVAQIAGFIIVGFVLSAFVVLIFVWCSQPLWWPWSKKNLKKNHSVQIHVQKSVAVATTTMVDQDLGYRPYLHRNASNINSNSLRYSFRSSIQGIIRSGTVSGFQVASPMANSIHLTPWSADEQLKSEHREEPGYEFSLGLGVGLGIHKIERHVTTDAYQSPPISTVDIETDATGTGSRKNTLSRTLSHTFSNTFSHPHIDNSSSVRRFSRRGYNTINNFDELRTMSESTSRSDFHRGGVYGGGVFSKK